MKKIDLDAFKFAISKIDDGFIFEEFSQAFLSASIGFSFIPIGGTKDKGIDGFQHIFINSEREKTIFQISTEYGYENKIYDTVKKLKNNNINFDKLIYITNKQLNNSDRFVDKFWNDTQINLQIFDIRWFVSNCSESAKILKVYDTFVNKYLHEYTKPGHYVTIANLDSDSRLYIFLSQQFTNRGNECKVDDMLTDSLILFSLEGTDPEKYIFKTESEIRFSIGKFIKFSGVHN